MSSAHGHTVIVNLLEGIRKRCPDHRLVLEALGDLYTKDGLIKEGLEIDICLTGKDPDNEMYWYNLGCSYALDGQVEAALDALRRCIKLGYDDVAWMATDDDLKSLRDRPEFRAIIAALAST
jgi:tetratricopeptide (TPR) repeat protein